MSNFLSPLLAFGIVDQDTVVLASVLAASGLLLIVGGWFGLLPAFTTDSSTGTGSASRVPMRLGLTAIGVVGGFLLTGWPVFAFFAGAFGAFYPTLRHAKRERRDAIDRVDAIATWVETIRDNISGAAGLTQALRNSASNAPEPIRAEVRDLVLRLQHESVVPSLRKFAADVAHPTADMAVGCLILASSRSAGNLSTILANTAQAARDSASMMRHVEAGRVQHQSQAKMVAGIAGAVSLMMILGDGEFLEPYNTLGGQIGLFVICMMGAVAVGALYKLAKPVPPVRVFAGVERAAPVVVSGVDTRTEA